MHLLWELEEEIGSPSFDGAMKKYGKQLATDSVLVSDTIWVSRERPACPAGLRGLQGFELVLETGATDQHSGVTGGAARNPIGELMKLVSEMYDATTGKVKIKGFYDDVEPPSKKELARVPRLRLLGQEVQEGPRLQIDPHRRADRRDEAHLGHADVRECTASSAATPAPASRPSSRRARR